MTANLIRNLRSFAPNRYHDSISHKPYSLTLSPSPSLFLSNSFVVFTVIFGNKAMPAVFSLLGMKTPSSVSSLELHAFLLFDYFLFLFFLSFAFYPHVSIGLPN